MRWWDNHGWTEHTTEARAPIVIQEAKLAWADDDAIDELPTRRERRERERGAEDGGSDTSVATAESLLQLEPPSWDELPADEPAPSVLPIPEFVGAAPGESVPLASGPAVAEPLTPSVAPPVAPPPSAAQPGAAPAAATAAAPVEYAQNPAVVQPAPLHTPGTPYATGT